MDVLPALKKLNDKEKLFIWLYFPYDIGEIDKTLDEMIKLSKRYGITDNILFRKVIEYLHIKSKSKDQIIDILYKYNFISVDNLANVIKIIDEILAAPLNVLDAQTLSKLLQVAKPYKNNAKCDHAGYPEVDEQLGRARLGWCVCYYEGCHDKFFGSQGLKEHLHKLNKYKYGFHTYHETAVSNLKLTPEKIIADNFIKCPSVVCDKGDYKFTPQELCEHFLELGIEPFWKPGMKIVKPKKKLNNIFDKIYVSDECLICLDEEVKPSMLFLPCNHCVICVNCYKPTNKCPMCRKDITNVIPI